MAEFLSELIVNYISDDRARLVTPLTYDSDIVEDVIIVSDGFETDFSSVPRVPIAYMVAGNVAHAPAVVHDWLYRNGLYTRKICDKVFLEAMKVKEISWVLRNIMYLAVRAFGGSSYKDGDDVKKVDFRRNYVSFE